jgi:DNA integrity scanning protein DisA with diadenylate cyclase activity
MITLEEREKRVRAILSKTQLKELVKLVTPDELEIIKDFIAEPRSEKSLALRKTKEFVDLMIKMSPIHITKKGVK